MFPIGQTFYIDEPVDGVEGVYLTKVDLYFKTKSSVYGVEVQLREVDNGFPTDRILPFSKVTVESVNVNVSDDASAITSFTFPAPVFCRAGKQYCVCIVPVGGNPDYNIWTSEIGGTDASTNTPIFKNNSTGDLFTSSSNQVWTPVQKEDLKFTIYTATFSQLSGNAIFTNGDYEYFKIKDQSNTFVVGEQIFMGDYVRNLARITIGSNTGFANGHYVYQSNSTANIASGYVYTVDGANLYVQNVSGTFSATGGGISNVISNNSSTNSSASAVAANVITSNTTNTVTLPFTSMFSTGQLLYFSTNNYNVSMVRSVVNVVNSTVLQLNTNSLFTDSNASFGPVYGNSSLYGVMVYNIEYNNLFNQRNMTLKGSTANSSVNFANTANKKLIGKMSGASANVVQLFNYQWDATAPKLSHIIPPNTSMVWSFKGVDRNLTFDTDFRPIVVGSDNELTDKPRLVMSRSNELNAGLGRSFQVKGVLTTSNNKISPSVDMVQREAITLRNRVFTNSQLQGATLVLSNVTGTFVSGETITQGSNTGVIQETNNSVMYVYSISGLLNTTTSITGGTSSATANITTITTFSEEQGNSINPSRYVSKKIVLSEDQDAEDIKVYVTAYRPANTELRVYGRFLSAEDSDTIDQKIWSTIPIQSPDSLRSSSINRDDFVELAYGLPESNLIFAASVSTSNASNNVTTLTSGFQANDFIYLSDNVTGAFNVRQIFAVTNNSSLTLTAMPSFTTANAKIGRIPGLTSTQGAFKYTANTGVIRYVSNTDTVFDTYKTFALKVVPLANSDALVPRAADIRAIALQT